MRVETHKVSQNTSCLSWSTSITSALESERQEDDKQEEQNEGNAIVKEEDRKLTVGKYYNTNMSIRDKEGKVKRHDDR